MKHCRTALTLAVIALATDSMSQAQNVVTQWNAIASNTIITQGGKAAYAYIYFAYASIAVYDATNSIHRRFQPFYFADFVDRDASEEAAAISASHSILVHYFPAQQGALDGLEANVPYVPGTAIGDWQLTPPGFLPPAVPWVGQMLPFTMKSASQFLPPGPYALSSEQWAADYNLTCLFGELNSTVRTPGQTEIGLFRTENPFQQDARIWTSLAQNYHLNVMDSARLMAVLWTGLTDSLIGCFNAKYTFRFWRPVTAIQAGGANSELAADPGWVPLAITPNHPEYPAAHGCGTSAVASLVATSSD